MLKLREKVLKMQAFKNVKREGLLKKKRRHRKWRRPLLTRMEDNGSCPSTAQVERVGKAEVRADIVSRARVEVLKRRKGDATISDAHHALFEEFKGLVLGTGSEGERFRRGRSVMGWRHVIASRWRARGGTGRELQMGSG